ncbi:hypothetical protein JCM11641_007721 [Rhodosporidiobolus odoratus]
MYRVLTLALRILLPPLIYLTLTSAKSPFCAKASILDDLPPKLALTLSQLANSLESIAIAFPTHSPAVQRNRAFGETLFSWIKLLLAPFSAFVKALTQLREFSEDVWRAAGGYVAAANSGPVSVDCEQPDPEGGSHTVTGRERLVPVSGTTLVRSVEKMRVCVMLFMEVEREMGVATQHLLNEAERFIAMLLPVENMALQMAPHLPGGAVPRVPSQQHAKTLLHAVVQLPNYPRQFYQILSLLSSDPSIAAGIWYSPSEAKDLFRTYRRIDSTIQKSLVQVNNAQRFMLENLQKAGYLAHSASPLPGGLAINGRGLGRSRTFPSLESERAEAPQHEYP